MTINILAFNIIDYAIIVILFVSMAIGLARGLVRETLSLVTWVLAFGLAIHFSKEFQNWIYFVQHEHIKRLIAFILIFLATLIVGGLISALINRAVHHIGLGGANRILGLIFGGLRGVLIVSLLIVAAQMGHLSKASVWGQAQLTPIFQPIVNTIAQLFPEALRDNAASFKHRFAVPAQSQQAGLVDE